MADEFLNLSREDQREVIVAAAPDLKLLAAVVGKDVCVKFCDSLSQNLAAPMYRSSAHFLKVLGVDIDELF